MGLFSSRSWLLWLVSLYCILQISSASIYASPDLEHLGYRIYIQCKNVNVVSNNTHVKLFHSSYEDVRPAASTFFHAKDAECALGSLENENALSAFFSEFDVDTFETSISIPPEKRFELTGTFDCNKTSVVNDIISFNESSRGFLFWNNDLEIKDSGVYCMVVRPLTSLGSSAGSYFYYYDNYNTDFPVLEPPFWSDLDFTPLIYTALLLFPACIWIYLLRSQPAKVLPIQYGLLAYILAIAIGITVDLCDEELYEGFNYPIELSIRCLLFLLASFGFGVWRPVQSIQTKFLFMVLGGLSSLLFLNILSTLLDTTPLLLLSQWLNASVSNVVVLSSIYVLYKEQKQFDDKSECSAKVCKRTLAYCIAVLALRPASMSTRGYDYSVREFGFVYWFLRYIVEIIIPCYIWYPSQNEQLAYTASINI